MRTRRGLFFIALIIAPFILGLLLTFQIIRIPFQTDMFYSPAIDYLESPRRLPPEGSVPVQGQAVIPGEFPNNPISPDEFSMQRGAVLYDIHCALCHGLQGLGDGPLAARFSRTPENLVSREIAAEFDGSVFLVITEGFGQMPSIAENLTPQERWDVINYVRTLPAGDE